MSSLPIVKMEIMDSSDEADDVPLLEFLKEEEELVSRPSTSRSNISLGKRKPPPSIFTIDEVSWNDTWTEEPEKKVANRSWVWKYATKKDEKALCSICNESISCKGGSTGSIGRHLKKVHNITHGSPKSDFEFVNLTKSTQKEEPQPSTSSNEIRKPFGLKTPTLCKARKRKTVDLTEQKCSVERIDCALAQLVISNNLPISFCSSEAYQRFMAVVEPNYKPCTEKELKTRLQVFYDLIKSTIKEELKSVTGVSYTLYCWATQAHDSYVTLTAHIIDNNWEMKSFNLQTKAFDDQHSAGGLAKVVSALFFDLPVDKDIVGIVTDNTEKMKNVVEMLSYRRPDFSYPLTCAAQAIELAVNKALADNSAVQAMIQKAKKIVSHFNYSNPAQRHLQEKQALLNMEKQTLLESFPTKWNSIYYMLERLEKNRMPILNVVADRECTNSAVAITLDMEEKEWCLIERLLQCLKPLDVVTGLLSSDKLVPMSMVRPLINKTIKNFLKCNDLDLEVIKEFKKSLVDNLEEKFKLTHQYLSDCVLAAQAAAFIDPRFKNLQHEENESTRQAIRDFVRLKFQLLENREYSCIEETESSDALHLIFSGSSRETKNDTLNEFDRYLAEAEIRFDANPFQWWKEHESRYKKMSFLAKRWLSIPATLTSYQPNFSTVLAKRSCLLPENMDLLVFLHQNHTYLNKIN